MNILINMFTELQQQGFQRYGSSTARTSQRQGSSVWVFHRWGSFIGGDGRVYFYDLLSARAILNGVYQ